MTARNKPYEQFGPYVLFKKVETSALGDVWRAARVDANTIATVVALRRLTGGNRDAMVSAISLARQVAPLLTGSSFAKEQVIDIIDGIPFVAHAYAGGRSLRHIVDRARGANGVQPNPIPIDQALVIAEKIALSLATIGELRFAGEKLSHAALVPEFVWISDDGEIRVAGQQLGKGILTYPNHFLSPEYRHSGQVTKSSEVYSVGAVLYFVLTGLEPPDPTSTSAFAAAIRAAKTMSGTPVPDDIQPLLTKSLNLDPNARFASVGDMKAALSALTTGGKYSATSFNLAMYVSNLLKKELEGEAIEREREAKTNFAPYVEALSNPAAVAAPLVVSPAGPTAKARKSSVPVAIAATLALALFGGGAWYVLSTKTASPGAAAPKLASAMPVAPAPKTLKQIVPEPILASPAPQQQAASTVTATTGTVDEAAQKKAFEDAVRQKLHAEMMKLQAEYTADLQKKQSKNAPVVVPPAPVTQIADATPKQAVSEARGSEPSAAQLDAQRLPQAVSPAETVAPQVTAPSTQPPVAAPVVDTQAQPPAPVVPQIHQGDVVDVTQVDVVPHLTREPRIEYPPIAARERAQANILTTILISENGDVLEVKILRGDSRFGFNEAAVRALKSARYAPAMKEGKRVKTWLPQMIQFKP